MDREIAFHIEMETHCLVREQHLPPDEALGRALFAFGGVAQHKEALRDGRGLAWLGGLRLDMTLGLRMLRKHPGLTIVGEWQWRLPSGSAPSPSRGGRQFKSR